MKYEAKKNEKRKKTKQKFQRKALIQHIGTIETADFFFLFSLLLSLFWITEWSIQYICRVEV